MLSRLALRIAVCEALAPTGASVFPTIAGPRVYDTRVDSLDSLDALDARPMVIVYAEEHISEPYGRARQPADAQTVTLTLELIIATRGEVAIEMDGGATEIVGTIDAPPTDAQREALLDLLEAEVRRALDRREMRQGRAMLDAVLWEVREAASLPLRDVDRTTRLAQRSLQVKVKIPNDSWPEPGAARGVGLDALPEPLRTVAHLLPAGSPHLAICEVVAGRISAPSSLPPPSGAALYVGVDRAAPPTEASHDVAAIIDPS